MPKAAHLFHFVVPANGSRRPGYRQEDLPGSAYFLKFELHCVAALRGRYENSLLKLFHGWNLKGRRGAN
jgi:hypothetical protein